MKICRKCRIEKPISEFNVKKANKDRLQSYCKTCAYIYQKQYREGNADRIRQYHRQYQKDNADHIRQYCRQYRKDHAEYVKKRDKIYREENAKRIRTYDRQYQNKLRQTARGKLNHRMCSLICFALKINQTSPTLEKMVGYTPQELKDHFESLFTEGMIWDNYGSWVVDHKKPICSFDYADADDPEFQECWALRNLQPLWREDNIKKGKNIPEEAIL